MPPPFASLTNDEFSELLLRFPFSRHINIVHVHHTWRPNHAQYRGHASIEGMWRHHTEVNGWRDIAQHVSIGPDGFIWLGRNWNLPPASAAGHNGTAEFGPFMIETIGDFDTGQDELVDPQRGALVHVIAAVQERFALPHMAVMFHNAMSRKTCPGSSVDFEQLVADVEAARPGAISAEGFAAIPDSQRKRIDETLAQFTRDVPAARGDETLAEHEPHDGFTLQRRERGGFQVLPGLTQEMIDALRSHVINLRGGQFSTDGQMTTAPADVDALVETHLSQALEQAVARSQPLRIVLYAHGGLVSESSGLKRAHRHLAWWKANGIYPINFVWETGLWEIVIDLLKKVLGQGERSIISDRITDPLIESALRVLPMDTVWRGMKDSAAAASLSGGGARYAIEKLGQFCEGKGDRVELHAVGHSAGSIFHAHLLDAARATGLPSFKTLQFLAPAARIDLFMSLVEPLLGAGKGVDELTMYTMSRGRERDDHCGRIYRKSLLYLVSASAEKETGAPILGLEESLRSDPAAAAVFGLHGSAGPGVVHWSRSAMTQATSHGGFDDDPATLGSVARAVLGLDAGAPIVPYTSEGTGARGSDARGDVDWPEAFRTPRPAATQPSRAGAGPHPARRGRRVALCIGIDEYARRPLSGCVNDARSWGAWLATQGFDVEYLLDGQATAEGIRSGMTDLLSGASRGDVVVIQFAGHGTQISDTSDDEADLMDEAWVPYDFLDGEFVLDDTLGALFDQHQDKGVELVLFTDCCHSGTNTRAAFSADSPVNDRSSRYLYVEPELQEAFNRKHPGAARTAARGGATGWEIHFAACQDQQSAYEENGSGKFTKAALEVLEVMTANGISYGGLADSVSRAFANDPRQTPRFRATSDKRRWRVFRGVGTGERLEGETSPDTAVETQSINAAVDMESIQRRLDHIVSLLGRSGN